MMPTTLELHYDKGYCAYNNVKSGTPPEMYVCRTPDDIVPGEREDISEKYIREGLICKVRPTLVGYEASFAAQVEITEPKKFIRSIKHFLYTLWGVRSGYAHGDPNVFGQTPPVFKDPKFNFINDITTNKYRTYAHQVGEDHYAIITSTLKEQYYNLWEHEIKCVCWDGLILLQDMDRFISLLEWHMKSDDAIKAAIKIGRVHERVLARKRKRDKGNDLSLEIPGTPDPLYPRPPDEDRDGLVLWEELDELDRIEKKNKKMKLT